MQNLQTTAKLGVLVIVVGAIAGAYAIFFLGPLSPISSEGETSIRQVIDNPGDFAGKEVTLQGELLKDPSFGTRPFLLSDGDGLLILRSEVSLDENVGLGVRVTGVIDFDEQAIGRPKTSLRVNNLELVEGTPTQFIELIVLETETSPQAGAGTHLIIDNSRNMLVFDLLNQRIFSRGQLQNDEVRLILESLIENRFFELESESFPRIPIEDLPQGDETRSFIYILKVIAVIDDELRENEITWIDTSFLPPDVSAIQELLKDKLLRRAGL